MKMIDALYPNGIPAGTTCDAVAAYIDHPANPQSFQQAVARFPNAQHFKISAHAPGTVGAHMLDVEPGTYITPQQAVAWVVASRNAGVQPTVYCNQLDPGPYGWAACRAAFAAAKVPEPDWWVANYDGDPTVPAGASLKQYTDLDPWGRNTYDTSATVPGWPRTPEADVTLEEHNALMTLLNIAQTGRIDGSRQAWPYPYTPIAAVLSTVQGQHPLSAADVQAAVKAAMPSATDADAQAVASAVLAKLGAALSATPAP